MFFCKRSPRVARYLREPLSLEHLRCELVAIGSGRGSPGAARSSWALVCHKNTILLNVAMDKDIAKFNKKVFLDTLLGMNKNWSMAKKMATFFINVDEHLKSAYSSPVCD